ncbi:DUF2188 domain-containing protein [Enterococcus xiangfangensis]|uniref:DUF2188 domain-containing protein n=1 Tax=Enterococcus xiangfangensis TaxID=1296537 RepID=UPI00195A8D8B|nr:DUF2188 domain-containing protein [Enterococcus xiangfangensis]MBM7712309.1 uncharacterized protein YdaT [Enterococcus xiangfangensis]
MPWNMNDYPASMKNLDPLIRKKAIYIGNALLHDGYPDERAIPIAISQAEKWFNEASAEEKKDFRKAAAPQKDDLHTQNKNAEKLLAATVKVQYEEPNWQVISEGASQASDLCATKEEAVARAKEIAKNKAVSLKIYKQDGHLQETHDYSKT